MTWYAAHIVMNTRNVNSTEIGSVDESIYLIESTNFDEALVKAEQFGKAEAVDDPTLMLGSMPAKTSFLGVRKIVKISNQPPLDQFEDRPNSGSEISYSRYEFSSEEELSKFVSGKAVNIKLIE